MCYSCLESIVGVQAEQGKVGDSEEPRVFPAVILRIVDMLSILT